MSRIVIPARRRIKLHGGQLGPFLCWAVVFADIGTSVYYVPGILYGQFGARSALFVLMTLFVFILLCVKYAEVAWRYPEGGGVVNVSSQALHPFAGLLGGLFILVDYYLTAALSALSGVLYLAVVAPALAPAAVTLGATVTALVVLGLLNAYGIKESARTTALFATIAAGAQLLVVIAVAISLGPSGIINSFHGLTSGPAIPLSGLVMGYAAAFLAFSGLESIAQLAPAMREPRRVVANRAMLAVVMTMVITSPLLTLWSTTLLPKGADPNQFISILGAHVAGRVFGDFVAVSGSLLLVFASNTAIIGAYHVFIALARMGFLPRVMECRNHWRRTPHWAILAAVLLPIIVVIAANAQVNILGDLYAFGLLGTFVLTCVSLDVVRWRERPHWSAGTVAFFAIGILTTLLVVMAWSVNLVAKPDATKFGGGLTVIGLVVGLATYRNSRRNRPAVFPVPFRPQRAAESIAHALGSRPSAGEVLVILPHEQLAAESVIAEAARAAKGRGAVFLYRGNTPSTDYSEFLEVSDPYLKDYSAHDAFARAERLARKEVPHRRYVYVPGNLSREVMRDIWTTVYPLETVVASEDQNILPPMAVDRVHRHVRDGTTVLHMFTAKVRRMEQAVAG
ncbi:MAG TPA: APC family permease [Candidatus Dormibacteraeota bacterium]|nr:APC family permease [Candidatus Dormibacteraeota bacterium]